MKALTSSEKGGVAELRIAASAAECGFLVSRPMTEGSRYDLIFDDGARLLRVQCKWAPRKGDVVVLRARTCRATAAGYVRTSYDDTEIDAMAAYCPDLERCFLVPIEQMHGQGYLQLRLSPARNNQRLGVKLAAQYELGL
jgi:hypothetical protein